MVTRIKLFCVDDGMKYFTKGGEFNAGAWWVFKAKRILLQGATLEQKSENICALQQDRWW